MKPDLHHLAKYGLTHFITEDQLGVGKVKEKGFKSSNFRVVKDALTKRLNKINGVLPVRYITDAIRGLIENHTQNTPLYDQIENLMIQTEAGMAQNNEQAEDAGVKAEMFWSSPITIQGTELCSILNAAIRDDDPINVVHAAVFAKGIEMRRNMGRSASHDLTRKYPSVKATADIFPGVPLVYVHT